jgi:hypothetical protein
MTEQDAGAYGAFFDARINVTQLTESNNIGRI